MRSLCSMKCRCNITHGGSVNHSKMNTELPPSRLTCGLNDAALGQRIMLAAWVYPANTRHSSDAVLMLGQRRRRWTNIKTALGECLVFAIRGNYFIKNYSLIISLKIYQPTSHFNPWSLDLFVRVPFQLHGDHTVLQPCRRIELLVHLAIAVQPGTHLHLRVKCLAQRHSIKTTSQY